MKEEELGDAYVLGRKRAQVGRAVARGGKINLRGEWLRHMVGTYDRPFDDILMVQLMVQDDIACEVTKALRNSIEGSPQT